MKNNKTNNIFTGLKIKKKELSDKEKEEMLAVFMNNIAEHEASPKRYRIRPFSRISQVLVAASVIGIICIVAWKYIPETTHTSTDLQTITLSDNTSVTLQKGATLAYSPLLFRFDRKVKLTGEAYFDVTKKGAFSVITDQGQVNVLGTEFVVSTTPVFSTQCYRGMVEVVSDKTKQKVILHPSEQASFIDDSLRKSDLTESAPYWVNNTFSFDSKPLSDVITILAQHYKLNVIGIEETNGLDFSGSFPADNRNIACELVFTPYDLRYRIEGDDLIISASH